MKELNRELTFNASHCVFQDLEMGRKTEIGLTFDGLYRLLVNIVIALIIAMTRKINKKANMQRGI